MRIVYISVIILSMIIQLSSCGGSYNGASGGILLDDDVLASILQENEDRENSLLAEDGEVFWTPSGSIWHATSDCPHIRNSSIILHGTVEEAMLDGKIRECLSCFADESDALYKDIENDPIRSDHVFFTRDGNEWHKDINCSVIEGAEKIYNASISKAKELGKTSACEECTE